MGQNLSRRVRPRVAKSRNSRPVLNTVCSTSERRGPPRLPFSKSLQCVAVVMLKRGIENVRRNLPYARRAKVAYDRIHKHISLETRTQISETSSSGWKTILRQMGRTARRTHLNGRKGTRGGERERGIEKKIKR